LKLDCFYLDAEIEKHSNNIFNFCLEIISLDNKMQIWFEFDVRSCSKINEFKSTNISLKRINHLMQWKINLNQIFISKFLSSDSNNK
jgi:hypothetical protein